MKKQQGVCEVDIDGDVLPVIDLLLAYADKNEISHHKLAFIVDMAKEMMFEEMGIKVTKVVDISEDQRHDS